MKSRIFYILLCTTLPFWLGCQTIQKSPSHGIVSSTPVPPEDPSVEPNADLKSLGIRAEVDHSEPPLNFGALKDVVKELSRYRRVAYLDLKQWKINRILVSDRARRWRNDLYLSEDCIKQGWTACRLSLEPDGMAELVESYKQLGISLDIFGYAYDAFPLLDFLENNKEHIAADLKAHGFTRIAIGKQTRVKASSARLQLNGWRHWDNTDQVVQYWDNTWRTYAQFKLFRDHMMKHMEPLLRLVDIDLDKTTPAIIEKWRMAFQNQTEFYKDVIRDFSIQRVMLSDQTMQWDDRLTLDASMHGQIYGPESLTHYLNKVADHSKALFSVGKIPVVVGSDERMVPSLKVERAQKLLTSQNYLADTLENLQIDRIEISRNPERFKLASTPDHKTILVLDPPDSLNAADWFTKNLQLAVDQRNRNFQMETHSLNRLVKAHVQIAYEDHTRVNPEQMHALFEALSHNSQWVTGGKGPFTIWMSDHMDRQRKNLYVDVSSAWFTSEETMTREIQRLFLNSRRPSGLAQSEIIQTYQNIKELQDLADVDDDGALTD